MQHLVQPQIDEISTKLTPRQSQVLKLICHRGLSNKAIGNILKITESTVKIHTSAILKRYGVKNRTQLVLAYNHSLKA
jgi:DNA-binding NarL/FixJ family response regulator